MPAPVDFLSRVHNATRDRFPEIFSEAALPSAYAVNLYEAILLFDALSRRDERSNAESVSALDGALLKRALPGISFEGVNGKVAFDSSGERKTPVQVLNFVELDTGSVEVRQVGVFDPNAGDGGYSSAADSSVVWPGGATSPPTDPSDGPVSTVNTAWLLVGAGASALVVVFLLLAIVKKQYRALQHILLMLMTEVGKLVGSLVMETVDLVTDWISCFRVLRNEGIVASDEYTVAYAMFTGLGTLSTMFSLFYRVRNGLLVQKHALKLARVNAQDLHSEKDSGTHVAQSYEWELTQSKRALVICGVEILTSVVQGIPMTVMNTILILGHGISDRMLMVSLMTSILLLGKKLTLGAQIVRIINRRTELQRNLEILMYRLEEEDLQDWLHGMEHDIEDRDRRIKRLRCSDETYTALEKATVAAGIKLLGMSSTQEKTKVKHSDTVELAYMRMDEETGQHIGEVRAVIRGASPQVLTAYLMNLVSFHNKLMVRAVTSRMEVLEQLSEHHFIYFTEKITRPFTNRTFLQRYICKFVDEGDSDSAAFSPPRSMTAEHVRADVQRRLHDLVEPVACDSTSAPGLASAGPKAKLGAWVVVAAPCDSHSSLKPEDEEGSIRAESWRCCRFTALNDQETLMEFACSLDLKGTAPQRIINTLVIPTMLSLPHTLQIYFLQLKPLLACDAVDGQWVGSMLSEVSAKTGAALAHELRTFIQRTTMLRECEFRHVGMMLVTMLVPNDVFGDARCAVAHETPAAVTREEARALGLALLSLLRSHSQPVSAIGAFSQQYVRRN